jgi:hypothetical protein
MDFASPDPRAQTQPRLWKTTNSASPDPGLGLNHDSEDNGLRLARPQGSDTGSASEDGLRLARPQGSGSTSTLDDELRLARPQGSDSTSTSEDRLDLDLGGASASPDLGLGPTTSQGGHHYPTPS